MRGGPVFLSYIENVVSTEQVLLRDCGIPDIRSSERGAQRSGRNGNPQMCVRELSHFGHVQLIAVYDQNILNCLPGGWFFSWEDRHWEKTLLFLFFLLATPPGM